jgi:hypothetical protein
VRIKDRDACWTVAAIDPFAVPLAAFAARFKPITPNRLTLLSTLVAAGAAVAFGFREFVLGAIVYQLAFLLDCMDGKVAASRRAGEGSSTWQATPLALSPVSACWRS